MSSLSFTSTGSSAYAGVMRNAAVSWAATLVENDELYVPDRSCPVHISCTLNALPTGSPGTFANENCLVAVLEDVLMINTWVPLEDKVR